MMLVETGYNRQAAVRYAKEWALKRNPRYLNFENLGGDCTNYASQCIYAGCRVMNYTKTFGWYYNSAKDRAPAWTGVQYLYQFLVKNKNAGPYARQVPLDQVDLGDIVQLGTADGHFYHSPVVCGFSDSGILICAHTYDALMRPLSSYEYDAIRPLHIEGCRKYG